MMTTEVLPEQVLSQLAPNAGIRVWGQLADGNPYGGEFQSLNVAEGCFTIVVEDQEHRVFLTQVLTLNHRNPASAALFD
jgi:hypothetical protein